jgi:hypothetical protein
MSELFFLLETELAAQSEIRDAVYLRPGNDSCSIWATA